VNVEPSSATSGGGAGTGPAGRIIARTASSNEALPDPFTIARRGYVRFDRVRISQPIPRSAAIDQMGNVCVCRNARRVPSAELRGRAASLSPVSCTGSPSSWTAPLLWGSGWRLGRTRVMSLKVQRPVPGCQRRQTSTTATVHEAPGRRSFPTKRRRRRHHATPHSQTTAALGVTVCRTSNPSNFGCSR
jgi:hypothetical protein